MRSFASAENLSARSKSRLVVSGMEFTGSPSGQSQSAMDYGMSSKLPTSHSRRAHGRLIRYPPPIFVVSDMLELAQAHAAYRFVVSDDARPRLIVGRVVGPRRSRD